MRQSTPLRSIVADIQDTLNIRWIFSNIYVIRSLKKPARHVRTFLLRASEFQKLLIQNFLYLRCTHQQRVMCVRVCLYCHYLGSDLRCSFFQYTDTRQSIKMQVSIRQFVRTRSDVSVL